ncbi:hypothetical protein H310_14849 [Aphanomyces invadans]|uniref:Thioredoxin domain-containing protein n=1 Tax=Aphanomyces invadans TaxID=157072 RepID=A0A024TAL2_9STRA|nr:hypothetical protein H310_14849 [Aphanomyces invadans]ETV90357.1 hypothetical protein H310_14849 [Aphanomyces invadans]RHY15894.1 hypothetical protein DYB32_010703 [Aphanomyces invadans]|eukprot:XP_008881012.1 hypothetical protein H310_14849 [Aphanomyces invadans]
MNAQVQQQLLDAVGNQVLESLQAQEERLDAEIKQLERIEEDDMDKLRERRLRAMKAAAMQKQAWKNAGHGTYSELSNQQEFFDVIKESECVVLHFYNATNAYCPIMDKHLTTLAESHLETRFCRMNAEKADYLVQKLGIWMIPCVALIKNKSVVHMLQGLDELGGTDAFSTHFLAYFLSTKNVLKFDGSPPESVTDTGVDAPKPAGPIKQSVFDYNSDDDDYD